MKKPELEDWDDGRLTINSAFKEILQSHALTTFAAFAGWQGQVAKGLRQVDATHAELMRSYAASNWDILRKVRVPNAVPYLFTALKVAAPLSVIYAYVSEYFGGAQNGLGSRIASNIANSKNAVGWAYVLGACLLGLTFYLISIAVEAAVTPGRLAQRNRDGS